MQVAGQQTRLESMTHTAQQSARTPELDWLRGLAVILMLNQHLGMWLCDWRHATGPSARILLLLNGTGGLAAPLFIFLSGIGAGLAASSALASPVRGAVLVAIGYLLNLLVPSWFSPASFYALHLIGFWLLVAPWFRRRSVAALAGWVVATLLVSAAGQAWLKTPMILDNARMARSNLELGIARLALWEGHFPIFPWLAVALTGAWAARLVRANRERTIGWTGIGLVLAGTAILGASRLSPALLWRSPWKGVFRFTFYPATTSFIVLLLGVVLILTAWALSRASRGPLPFLETLGALGRSSLTIFFVHIVLFREGLSRLGAMNSLTPGQTAAAILLALAFVAWLARAWKRSEFRYGLEWLLRRIAGATRAPKNQP
jgi:uncharacterized membrane protein